MKTAVQIFSIKSRWLVVVGIFIGIWLGSCESQTPGAETTINPKLIETVAAEAGVKLAPRELYSDSIGASGSEGDSYINMLVANTRTIVEALGGQYKDFEFSNSVKDN